MHRIFAKRPTTLGAVAVASVIWLAGCATPPEIKEASETQLRLMGELEQAVVNFDQALVEYSNDQRALILQESTVLIAQQAIEDALATNAKPTTADQVFKVSQAEVQPAIGGAFQIVVINAEIAALEKQIDGEENELRKQGLIAKKGAFEDLRAELDFKRSDLVKEVESVILEELTEVHDHQRNTTQKLALLRQQVKLMKELAEHVNRWLAIDVTISEDDARSLQSALDTAFAAEGGGQ